MRGFQLMVLVGFNHQQCHTIFYPGADGADGSRDEAENAEKKWMEHGKEMGTWLGCESLGSYKELGVIYFPTNWGAKEPQNLPNHRVGDAIFFQFHFFNHFIFSKFWGLIWFSMLPIGIVENGKKIVFLFVFFFPIFQVPNRFFSQHQDLAKTN